MDRLLEATRRAERTHFWFRGFRRFVRPSLARAAGACPSATLLDCGCGTGANLTLLNRFGRAYGIDLSPTGIRLTRASDIPRVGRASVDRLPFPDTTFDIVTSFDVLYCLPNQAERQGIAEMFRVLRPGGFALINVPALDGLRGHHSVLSQEIRRYRPSTLRALVERAGFEIERLTFTNASARARDAAGAVHPAADGSFRGTRGDGYPCTSSTRQCVALGDYSPSKPC